MKILYLLPNLEHNGPAHEATLLATKLLAKEWQPHVCCLSRNGPLGERLEKAGVPVEALNWNRRIDLRPFLRLHQLVQALNPEIIHVWRSTSLRAASVARCNARLVVSDPIVPRDHAPRLTWLDGWLLQRAARICANGAAAISSLRQCGISEDLLVLPPRGVEISEATTQPVSLPTPAGARLITCVGPLLASKGFREAIWAFDILRYVYDDLHLLLIGSGPNRERLDRFRNALGAAEQVHFLGPRDDVREILAQSEIVWVPSRDEGGDRVALEAAAAGRPVVASDLPGLAEIVRHGETGLLATPRDPAALARQTKVLLDDPELGKQYGAAGRERAVAQFNAAEMVKWFLHMYEAAIARIQSGDVRRTPNPDP